MSRTSWLPLLLGFLLGAAGGVYYAWVVDPVEYVDTAPASLRQDFREDYLALIASAYAGTGDLQRARARLALIPEANPAEKLGALAQQRLERGRPQAEVQALAALAAALGERPTPLAITATPLIGASSTPPARGAASPFPTRTATPTRTPLPTRAPTATPGAPFALLSKEALCEADLSEPLIQVEVFDAAGQPVPGVEILVLWDAGQDHFFTGLKADAGPGYGDFAMAQGVVYAVQVAHGGEQATGLQATPCVDEEGRSAFNSWYVRFLQPALGPTPTTPTPEAPSTPKP